MMTKLFVKGKNRGLPDVTLQNTMPT